MGQDISQVLSRSDVVTHLIAAVLIVMSVSSWAVIFYKGLQMLRVKRQGAIAERKFWNEDTLETAIELFGPTGLGNPYVSLVGAAQEARDRHDDVRLREALSSDEWLQRCLSVAFEEQVGWMTRGLGVLASVGSTAPFVGLFGTVWGIYHALANISATGQSSLPQVAGPVGESLVMTALGLFVAIPAVLGYNMVSRINRGTTHKLIRFRHELHAYLMGGKQRAQNASLPTIGIAVNDQ
ncbi:MotA/TolQ/ExbB proton channel family protein [Burkholderia metallica]|uniref:MotA/TolQ/ExbB proton channel family protein n=1 Tax=Burkholderia metallica TaxID=488729 RepID=UPI00157AC6D1|nr:MotA/TolQ/ExbB proton channel family protein [Burkholderia metallica]NTZ83621.1 MotA/TolQ/ExbB proton channel family protein [Burkholderia metallica]